MGIGKREANGVPLPLYSRARQDKTRQEMAFAMRHSSRVTLRKAPKLSVNSRGARGASRSVTVSAATTETLSKVQGIIAEQLGADSLDTVEIMMALEEEFDITLDEEGAENIATVQQAADMIEDMK